MEKVISNVLLNDFLIIQTTILLLKYVGGLIYSQMVFLFTTYKEKQLNLVLKTKSTFQLLNHNVIACVSIIFDPNCWISRHCSKAEWIFYDWKRLQYNKSDQIFEFHAQKYWRLWVLFYWIAKIKTIDGRLIIFFCIKNNLLQLLYALSIIFFPT